MSTRVAVHDAPTVGTAIITGPAITGMRYRGMGAANLGKGSICLSAQKLDANLLALVVSASSLAVLIGTLAFPGFHTRSLSNSLGRANSQLHHLGTHDTLTSLAQSTPSGSTHPAGNPCLRTKQLDVRRTVRRPRWLQEYQPTRSAMQSGTICSGPARPLPRNRD
jgi:hypothetical protein